jgi:hypothetical protein
VIHETLSIEAGAHLEGNCRRLQTSKPAVGEAKVSELKPAAREGSGPTASGTGASESVAKPAAS